MSPDVKTRFIEAIKYLEAEGVNGYTGDCGFMMNFQQLARTNTKLPVYMSSLCQLPSVTCAYGQNEKIAIFTANGVSLAPMRDLIRDECGVDTEQERYIIVGCENVDHFGDEVAKGLKVNTDLATPGIVKKALETQAANPEIRAFLFECTELPQFSDAVRAATGLPVYDSITMSDSFMSGVTDNKRFGLNDWQGEFDGKQADYKFGDEVAAGDKVDTDLATPGMVQKALEVQKANPDIRAFLFECTELPQFSDAVRAATGLPVYDSMTMSDSFMSGVMNNKRFGKQDWQAEFDGKQVDYKFGDDLTDAERKEVEYTKLDDANNMAALEQDN